MNAPKTTTLNKIRDFKPCADGWAKLLKHLGKIEADDEPLLMSTILKSNGFNDALWCLQVFHADHSQTVIDFACDCAQRVLPIWEKWAEKNAPKRLMAPRKAIEAARSGDSDAAVAAARTADAPYAAASAAADARADARAAEQSEQEKLLIKYFG